MTRALQGAHIREVMDLSNPLSITGSSKAPPVEAQCQVSAVSAEMGGYETSAAFAKAGNPQTSQTLEMQHEPVAPSIEAPSISTLEM